MSHPGLPHDAVLYPCSDGQPMAETEIHGACMMYVTSALRLWFEKHGRADVHVGSNSFLYYERDNPRAVVAPDVYVVVGARAYLRDTYLLWNEPKGPDFVLEVTSASTRRADERRKRDVYASLGVSEYFLYDPRAEYLDAAASGLRAAGRKVPAAAGGDGAVEPRGGGGERGAGAGASRRARGTDGAAARSCDRGGSPHVRGSRCPEADRAHNLCRPGGRVKDDDAPASTRRTHP